LSSFCEEADVQRAKRISTEMEQTGQRSLRETCWEEEEEEVDGKERNVEKTKKKRKRKRKEKEMKEREKLVVQM